MAEPDFTPTMGANDEYTEVFWQRLDFALYDGSTAFTDWQTYVTVTDTSDTDKEWFGNEYSSYVLQLNINNTNAIIVSPAVTGAMWTASH